MANSSLLYFIIKINSEIFLSLHRIPKTHRLSLRYSEEILGKNVSSEKDCSTLHRNKFCN
jgi:hypothetical protein